MFEVLEAIQILLSAVILFFALVVLRDAMRDLADAKGAQLDGSPITQSAVDIAKERVIIAGFVTWVSVFMFSAGIYSFILSSTVAETAPWFGQMGLQYQAFMMRIGWRMSVLAFIFVRWRTRGRIRREANLT